LLLLSNDERLLANMLVAAAVVLPVLRPTHFEFQLKCFSQQSFGTKKSSN
jgi:hypothetical protein